MSGPVRDFDFHPDEDGARVFTAEPDGVLRFSSEVYVCAARHGDVVLWHYAFLSRACPIGPLQPPAAAPAGHVPLWRVPLLNLQSRAAWLRSAELV